ncbi:hypothetical protein IE077_002259 [Cardiosporidium cionae]|uniref:RRM domain-containing protein n=1 Tax=Cardiosporidium cionae TaxID=476202 RepID=A0ABQ7JBG5_9APIC|nr:hypothetical protein IE077_002259 [Cardiosporidium cionae]|eukprot:KAF8821249.1 hypothetical protein IE077_002259 [Cardiosporidium cionae]
MRYPMFSWFFIFLTVVNCKKLCDDTSNQQFKLIVNGGITLCGNAFLVPSLKIFCIPSLECNENILGGKLLVPVKKADLVCRQMRFKRWQRPWRTKSLKRGSGSNHILELVRERRLLCERTDKPITQGANVLFISNVDLKLTKGDVEKFFDCWYGLSSCHVKLIKDKETGAHRGFGFVKFTNPWTATTAFLKLNGVKLGDKNILLKEAYLKAHLKTKKISTALPSVDNISEV